jgi:predicted aminopeptidase
VAPLSEPVDGEVERSVPAPGGPPPEGQSDARSDAEHHRSDASGSERASGGGEERRGARLGRVGRIARRVALLLLVLVVGYLLTPTGRYLLRAGWEEGKILTRRRPIAELVRDRALPDSTRAKLALVLAARDFAADSLGLDVGESFTTFSPLERDTLVLVLSAAHQDRLRFRTWWFPIVGSVPYKGFFDFDAARAAARELHGDGFDAYLRPASAFSTLGWFNDPLLSTTLKDDSLDLANTVIHEVVHNTYYASGRAVFNESFANFVGSRGAARFFRARGQERAAREVEVRWRDELLLGAFWSGLYAEVDSAFEANPDDRAARLAARRDIYREARIRLQRDVAPRLRTVPPTYAQRARLDNAALMARRIYLTDLELFEAVWNREGRDLRRTVERIIALAKSNRDEPFEALRGWVGTQAIAEAAAAAGDSIPASSPSDSAGPSVSP